MRERVLKKYAKLQALKTAFVSRLSGVPEDRLQLQPGPGRWSAAQIMDHIASAEAGSLEYIRKKTRDPEAVPAAGFMCAVRTLALVVTLATPLKFKAPRVVADVPDNPPVDGGLARWEAVRVDLKGMIETLPEELMARALFRHPVAGRMNMSQTLDFMIAHLKHHTKQLDHTLR